MLFTSGVRFLRRVAVFLTLTLAELLSDGKPGSRFFLKQAGTSGALRSRDTAAARARTNYVHQPFRGMRSRVAWSRTY
jgi:hypothetical protein